MSLATLVQPREAELFQELATTAASSASDVLDDAALMTSIREAIREAIGGDVVLQVKGSIMKGTQTRSSDLDIIVDTPGRRVSRSDKESVVESLKRSKRFHESHVKLKTLAIQCVPLMHTQEIELIFSNTLEFGQLPSSHDRFVGNTAAQHAARMLKISVNLTLSGRKLDKVPGFLLELLVLEVQEAMGDGQYERLADGSMQLFLASLQTLCDDGDILGSRHLNSQLALSLMERNYEPGEYQYPAPESRKESSIPGRAGPIGYNARVLLREHAYSVLGSFTASRMFTPDQSGLTNIVQVELLVRNKTSTHAVGTALGPVPSWVFGYVLRKECHFYLICADDGVPESMRVSDLSKMSEEWSDRQIRMVDLFCSGPFGKYTANGQADRRNHSARWRDGVNTWVHARSTMMALGQYAQAGSLVAERMLSARMLWLDGEDALVGGRDQQAVKFFADSLAMSISDGDPFSGWWSRCGDQMALKLAYSRAIKAVLRTDPHSADARLVQGRMFLEMGNAAAGERVLSSAIADAPDDMRPFAMRAIIRGNLGKWDGCLEDTTRCIELDPLQPIHYFWRSVAMRNLGSRIDYDRFAEDLHHFIAIASPEGRKVCQAWWNLSFITLSREGRRSRREKGKGRALSRHQSDCKELAVRYAKQGFEAEKRMLPPLREHDAKSPSSGRDMAKMLVAMDDPSGSALFEQADKVQAKMRERANEAFRCGRYEAAVAEYTKLLEWPRVLDHHIVLSNRSAAFAKLEDFAAAENVRVRECGWRGSGGEIPAHVLLDPSLRVPTNALHLCALAYRML